MSFLLRRICVQSPIRHFATTPATNPWLEHFKVALMKGRWDIRSHFADFTQNTFAKALKCDFAQLSKDAPITFRKVADSHDLRRATIK
jgi:hypothetical protein